VGIEKPVGLLIAIRAVTGKSLGCLSMQQRRTVIRLMLKALSVVPLGGLFLHSTTFAFGSLKNSAINWHSVGYIGNFAVGKMARGSILSTDSPGAKSVGKKTIFIWRVADEQFVVYSASCTDLGCPVNWDAGSEWFFCPCHGGIFSKTGEPKAGPPKKPLYRYAYRINNGQLEIDLNSVPKKI